MSKFHQRLIDLRKEHHETQNDVSNLTGKSRSAVQGYETEGKEPPYDVLCLLADHYGVTTDYLLGHSDFRTTDDTIFVGDSRSFSVAYGSLPEPLRAIASTAFGSLYKLLEIPMKARSISHLRLYAELFDLLQSSRSEIQGEIDHGSARDPLFIAELMGLQSKLKSDSSVLYDRLLQADMGISDTSSGEKTKACNMQEASAV